MLNPGWCLCCRRKSCAKSVAAIVSHLSPLTECCAGAPATAVPVTTHSAMFTMTATAAMLTSTVQVRPGPCVLRQLPTIKLDLPTSGPRPARQCARMPIMPSLTTHAMHCAALYLNVLQPRASTIGTCCVPRSSTPSRMTGEHAAASLTPHLCFAHTPSDRPCSLWRPASLCSYVFQVSYPTKFVAGVLHRVVLGTAGSRLSSAWLTTCAA